MGVCRAHYQLSLSHKLQLLPGQLQARLHAAQLARCCVGQRINGAARAATPSLPLA